MDPLATHPAEAAVEETREERRARGHALVRAGAIDDAEAVFAAAIARFGSDLGFHIEHARIPSMRKDWQEAHRRWSGIRDMFPDAPVGYIGCALSLRDAGNFDEAAALFAQITARFPDNPSAFVEQAALEARRGRWDAAIVHWSTLRQKFPDNVWGYLGALEAYREIGKLDEAESLAAAATTRFPDERNVAFIWADLAARRRDWSEAARRWLALKEKYPAEMRCVNEAARALLEVRDHDNADALLARAVESFREDKLLAFRWAELADQSGSASAAAARWAVVAERFPGEKRAYMSAMRALVEAGDLAEAEEMARLAITLFPTEADTCLSSGDIAVRRRDYAAAAERFAAAYAADPQNTHTVTRYVEALLRLDRRAEAAAVLDQALARWPRNETLIRWRIENALRSQAFDDAISVWAETASTWGDDRGFPSDIATLIFSANPPVEAVEPLLAFFSSERDTGERMWIPRLAALGGHIPHQKPQLREALGTYALLHQARMDVTCYLLWKSLTSLALTDQEIETAFDIYLAYGRMAIVATLFSDFARQLEPSLERRTAAAFERFIQRKLANQEWIIEDNPLELLSYLMFAAVFSPVCYQQLAAAGLARLEFKAIPDDAAPETAVTALARLLAGRRRANVPAVIARATGRLKIAMCVSGQLRGYERALPTWKNLGLDGHDTSVFVHTWKDTGRNWGRTWWFLRNYPALWQSVAGPDGIDFLRRRFPRLGAAVAAAIAHGMDTSEDKLKTFYQTDDVVVEDDRKGPFLNRPNVWKMHHKIERAHRMALARMPDDSLFIRLRPDQGFGPCEPIDWERIHHESQSERMLFADIAYVFTGSPGILKVADAFLAGAREPMTAFAGVYSDQVALMDRGSTFFDAQPSLLSHSSVAFCTFYQGVSVRHFHAAKANGFLEATVLPPALVLELLRQDVGENPTDQLERDFLEACDRVAG